MIKLISQSRSEVTTEGSGKGRQERGQVQELSRDGQSAEAKRIALLVKWGKVRTVGGGGKMSRRERMRCEQWGWGQLAKFLESLVKSFAHYLKSNEKSSKSFRPKGVNFFTLYMFTQICIRTGLNAVDLLYSLDILEYPSQNFLAFRVLNYWTFSNYHFSMYLTTNNIDIYRTQKEYFV